MKFVQTQPSKRSYCSKLCGVLRMESELHNAECKPARLSSGCLYTRTPPFLISSSSSS